MPIIINEPPVRSVQLASEGVRALQNQSVSLLSNAIRQASDLAVPHQTFFLSLEGALTGKLDQAQATGWRYLVLNGDEAVAAAVVESVDPETMKFSHLNEGQFVGGSQRAIAVVETLPQIENQDYALRLLDVPSLYVVAFWLHGETEDLFMPIAPVPAGLEPERSYSEAQFFAAIREQARTKRDFVEDDPELSMSGS